MSGANYAHCDVEPCLKPSGSTKVFYIGDEDLPFGTVVRHGECDDSQLAAAEERGYQRAIAALRDTGERWSGTENDTPWLFWAAAYLEARTEGNQADG